MKNFGFIVCLMFSVINLPAADKEWKIWTMESPYQQGRQEIRVLLPDNYDPDKKYRVVYVLPVGIGPGSALRIFKKENLQNRFGVILVEMTYEKAPWFGDHATDPLVRQESYLTDFVVPFVEKNYSTVGTAEGRLLFGFSKSGWGAYALILRQPDFFGYAAAWDAPFLFDDFHYGMDEVFGTKEQLAKYRPDLLVTAQARHFQEKTRLVMGGEEKWGTLIPTPSGGSHTVEMHDLMEKEGVRHLYRPDLKTLHTWSKDWIVPLFGDLMKLTESKSQPSAS